MQPAAATSLAYCELNHLAPPADKKAGESSTSAVRLNQQLSALSRLDVLARGTDRVAASEAVEVLMNTAALGVSCKPLAARAVKILEAIHTEGKTQPSVKSLIRQQAQVLCDYTHLACEPVRSSDGQDRKHLAGVETKGGERPAAQPTALLPQAIQDMAAHAAVDVDAGTLYRRFQSEFARSRPAAARIELPASRPGLVQAALQGLKRIQLIGMMEASAELNKKEFEAAMGKAVVQLIDQNIPDAVAGQPRALVVHVVGRDGAPDRWGVLVACRAAGAPQKHDILLLDGTTPKSNSMNHRLIGWLKDSFPEHINHVIHAGTDRPKPVPGDGGLFIAHALRQLDQQQARGPADFIPNSEQIKLQLDENVSAWCGRPGHQQVKDLSSLPGVAAAIAATSVEDGGPHVRSESPPLWWVA